LNRKKRGGGGKKRLLGGEGLALNGKWKKGKRDRGSTKPTLDLEKGGWNKAQLRIKSKLKA